MQDKLIAWRKYFSIEQEGFAKLTGFDVCSSSKQKTGTSLFKANGICGLGKALSFKR